MRYHMICGPAMSVSLIDSCSAQEMDKAVERFSQDPCLATTDSVFVVIMSHGVKGAILGVHHSDADPDQFPIDNIYKHLDSNHCRKLVDKPKVIIIQACRGGVRGVPFLI